MLNKNLLSYLFKDYIPELGSGLVDIVLHELYKQHGKYEKTTDILNRHIPRYDIYSTSSDNLRKHRHELFYMVYPPNYLEKEVQSTIFKTVIPIIIANFVAYIEHNPLDKTQIVSMYAWVHQLHSLGLSGTANLLDHIYVHHSLSL